MAQVTAAPVAETATAKTTWYELPGDEVAASMQVDPAAGLSSAEAAARLLDEAGIACLAGTAFGSYGEGYLRFSYASSEDNIRKMLKKLDEFVSGMLR